MRERIPSVRPHSAARSSAYKFMCRRANRKRKRDRDIRHVRHLRKGADRFLHNKRQTVIFPARDAARSAAALGTKIDHVRHRSVI